VVLAVSLLLVGCGGEADSGSGEGVNYDRSEYLQGVYVIASRSSFNFSQGHPLSVVSRSDLNDILSGPVDLVFADLDPEELTLKLLIEKASGRPLWVMPSYPADSKLHADHRIESLIQILNMPLSTLEIEMPTRTTVGEFLSETQQALNKMHLMPDDDLEFEILVSFVVTGDAILIAGFPDKINRSEMNDLPSILD